MKPKKVAAQKYAFKLIKYMLSYKNLFCSMCEETKLLKQENLSIAVVP